MVILEFSQFCLFGAPYLGGLRQQILGILHKQILSGPTRRLHMNNINLFWCTMMIVVVPDSTRLHQ